MDQLINPPLGDDTIDEHLAANDADELQDFGTPPYVPDPRILWGLEEARAMLVVLTRRLGPDFAQEVSNELASRRLAYQAGCPDDQRDGDAIEGLICDKMWDDLFATKKVGAKKSG